MIINLDGKWVVKKGHRLFALPKTLSTADRIHQACNTELTGSWEQAMTIPKPRIRNTRSIRGSRG